MKRWNGTEWVPIEVTGPSGSLALTDLTDVDADAAAPDEALVKDVDGIWRPKFIDGSGGGTVEPGNIMFIESGLVHEWVVPTGVTTVTFDVRGAGEDRLGGRVTGDLAVTPGATLNIRVGGVPVGGTPGFNGGGVGFDPGCGASDIRIGGDDLIHRKVVAGGAGGGGAAGVSWGGAGGGLVGEAGAPGYGARQGDGGSQVAGGIGRFNGQAGTLGVGGTGSGGTSPGGGGGGGYYGGGGAGSASSGTSSGGGGGSSYTDEFDCSNVVHEQGVRAGDGLVRLEWS